MQEAKRVLAACDDFVTTDAYYHQRITADQILTAREQIASEIEKISKVLGD